MDLSFIDSIRKQKKIKRSDMSRHANISLRYYCRIIAGQANPSLIVAEALLDKIGYKLIVTFDV